MAGNIDVLKGAYEGFAAGDVEGTLEAFSDDAVWQGPNSTELPGGGEHRGKEAVGEALKSIGGDWDEFDLTADEFYENAESVVVLLHVDVKKGDESGELPAVHVARFEDGKIKRFQTLTDTLHAAQLLGLIGGKPPEES